MACLPFLGGLRRILMSAKEYYIIPPRLLWGLLKWLGVRGRNICGLKIIIIIIISLLRCLRVRIIKCVFPFILSYNMFKDTLLWLGILISWLFNIHLRNILFFTSEKVRKALLLRRSEMKSPLTTIQLLLENEEKSKDIKRKWWFKSTPLTDDEDVKDFFKLTQWLYSFNLCTHSRWKWLLYPFWLILKTSSLHQSSLGMGWVLVL